MSKAIKLTLNDSRFKKWDVVTAGRKNEIGTVVASKNNGFYTTYTIKKIKWSRYRWINLLKRLLITIRY